MFAGVLIAADIYTRAFHRDIFLPEKTRIFREKEGMMVGVGSQML